MNKLEQYGFTERFRALAGMYPDFITARVISQYKDLYRVVTEDGELLAEVSGKLRYDTQRLCDFPAVGDFVMIDRSNGDSGNGIIHQVLPRKSLFERRAAGTKNDTQVVAANMDIVFICMSLNNDYNLRRLERYLSIAWDSRAIPVVVLTKSDLCTDIDEKLAEICRVAIGVDIVVTSGFDPTACSQLQPFLKGHKTAVFIGSSGVGKSTLINTLIGDALLETAGIRDDDKGRHTTTRRDLILLPSGGIVIDTPGMREIGVDTADLSKSFADIDTLAAQCRFSDCTHSKELGCAVKAAIENGQLDQARFENYLKLKKEARYDGLTSRQIESEKLSIMFADVGGMKGARKLIKEIQKRKH